MWNIQKTECNDDDMHCDQNINIINFMINKTNMAEVAMNENNHLMNNLKKIHKRKKQKVHKTYVWQFNDKKYGLVTLHCATYETLTEHMYNCNIGKWWTNHKNITANVKLNKTDTLMYLFSARQTVSWWWVSEKMHQTVSHHQNFSCKNDLMFWWFNYCMFDALCKLAWLYIGNLFML